jgi:hypothetical protein
MGSSAKDRLDSRVFAIRKERRASPPHGFRRVPNEIVDQPLVYALTREIAGEAVSQEMPTPNLRPLATAKHPFEMHNHCSRQRRQF